MANRTFMDASYTLIKREVRLFAAVSVGAAGAVTLQKWNYPVFGTGPNARTYTAAPSATSVPSGTGAYPLTYTAGAEGIFSVTRTGVGLWTIKFQDTYQRMVGLAYYASLAGGLSNIVAIHENTTISSMGTAGGSVFGLALLSATGAAADPTSGTVINLKFTLADATEP